MSWKAKYDSRGEAGTMLLKNGFVVEVARTIAELRARLPEIDQFNLLILVVTLSDSTGFRFFYRCALRVVAH